VVSGTAAVVQSWQTETTEEVAGLTTVHPPAQLVMVKVVASLTV
jgi:hypothetical protein